VNVLLILLLSCSPLLAAQDAERARELYDRAIELDAHGNGGAALSLLWEAAGLAPRDADIQNRLGEALEKIGALDAAVGAYRAALEARPSFRNASNNLILALVKAGKADEAIARARALTKEAPDDPEPWFTLGLAQSDADVDGAIDSFHHALQLSPKHTLARYNLALVLYHADRLQPALDELQQALSIEPRAEVYYTLGIIRWHEGDLDRAADALRRAVRARADYQEAWFALGSVLKARGDLKEAVSALKRAIALRPDLSPPHYTLAQTLQAAHDESGARKEFTEAERLRRAAQQAQEAGVWTAVGTQKLDSGDADGALECFRRAVAALDTFAPAHYQMGRAFERLGQRDAARAAFARAQQLNPALVPPKI
jgi:tetratricopeptide (TPR) repeat protein